MLLVTCAPQPLAYNRAQYCHASQQSAVHIPVEGHPDQADQLVKMNAILRSEAVRVLLPLAFEPKHTYHVHRAES